MTQASKHVRDLRQRTAKQLQLCRLYDAIFFRHERTIKKQGNIELIRAFKRAERKNFAKMYRLEKELDELMRTKEIIYITK